MAGKSAFAQALDAFGKKNFDEAVDLFDEAVDSEPRNVTYLLKRAECHLKLESYAEAVADATLALKLQPANTEAHYRKGIACFHLGEHPTALAEMQQAVKADPRNPLYITWLAKLAKLVPGADDAVDAATDAYQHTAPISLPPQAQPQAQPQARAAQPPPKPADHQPQPQPQPQPPTSTSTSTSAPAPAPAPAAPAAVAGRIRHEWYQSAGTVVVSVLVKKAAREDVSVQFGPRTLDVDVKLPAVGTTYNLDLDLCDEIVPGECKYEVLGSKVEITLKKRSAGVKWATLEWTGSEAHAGAMAAGVAGVAVTAAGERPDAGAGSGAKTQGRGYRDWDKLAVEIAEEEKNEKLEGDQALNKLFQDIFANADEDTRRAMNKSFVESGGTVLSTNWKEVGAKTVECTPPDGLEVKRFEH